MSRVMIALVRFYQRHISPLKPPCCRFTPTCSAYAIEAFTKRGFFVGLLLTVWRILRCNPFCKGGYDPVPLHGLRNPRCRICEDVPAETQEQPNEESKKENSIDEED